MTTPPLDGRERAVVLFSGHMVDALDRPEQRFPPSREAAVGAAIGDALTAWGIGPEDLCLSSGARGSDILFAERCLAAGASVRWLLPLPLDAFLGRSVRGAGGDWERRFLELLDRVDVCLAEDGLPAVGGESPFVRGNRWLIATAEREASPGQPRALLVWDGQAGDGVGGTSEIATEVRRRGWVTVVIDPSPT